MAAMGFMVGACGSCKLLVAIGFRLADSKTVTGQLSVSKVKLAAKFVNAICKLKFQFVARRGRRVLR